MIKIVPHHPAIILAPMEGVTDPPMRSLLTEVGGFTHCISEFPRIAHQAPPAKVYQKHVPEWAYQWQTIAKTPVQIQLLGRDPEILARGAVTARELGALAIDLNFGCPAPTVNRSDGGATLLKYPQRIYEIVKSVREAAGASLPVSAKLRLGWDDPNAIFKNAEMAELGGANWITIHGRTRFQGYCPPVDWKKIGEVRRSISIPVVANGDIWTFEDFLKCQEMSECKHFMLGRGAVVNPYLALRIARELGLSNEKTDQSAYEICWKKIIHRYIEIATGGQQAGILRSQISLCGRIKQWGKMVSLRTPAPWYEKIKGLSDLDEILQSL